MSAVTLHIAAILGLALATTLGGGAGADDGAPLAPVKLAQDSAAAIGCHGDSNRRGDILLSFDEQLEACNTYVSLTERSPLALHRRAIHLNYDGVTRENFEQAYRDYSELIEMGDGTAGNYHRRSVLRAQLFGEFDAALVDVTRAIAMRLAENDRTITVGSGFLPHSIALRARIAQRDDDAAMLAMAVAEIDRLLEAHPASRFGQRALLIVQNCQTRIALGQADGPADCAWLPTLMRTNHVEYSDPLELAASPQHQAMVDCITGRAALAWEERLTLDAQIAACDRFVDSHDDPIEALLIRADVLFLQRDDAALWDRAYADFSTVIEAASEGVMSESLATHARARRAEVSFRLNADLHEALTDISLALPEQVDPGAEIPFGLVGDLALRVNILTALAQETGDVGYMRHALADIETVLAVDAARPDYLFIAPSARRMLGQNILIRSCLAAVEAEDVGGPAGCFWLTRN